MVLIAAVLVLVAVGLLVVGVVQGEPLLQWSSFGVSALATLLLAVGALRRRVRTPRPDDVRTPYHRDPPSSEPMPRVDPPSGGSVRLGSSLAGLARGGEDDEVVRRVSPPPVPPSSPMLPRVDGPPSSADDWPPAGATGQWAAVPPPAPTGQWAAEPPPAPVGPGAAEPPAEEVEFSDLLLIMDLTDEVLVVDERPRYHVAGCPRLSGVPTIPVPMVQARTDGFTPCGVCTPDRTMAQRERARRS